MLKSKFLSQLVRFVGLTSHNRRRIATLAPEGLFDVFHVRYNAAHRWAEEDIFPHLAQDNQPGMVSFTATAWKRLLTATKLPPGPALSRPRPATDSRCPTLPWMSA